MVYYHYRDSRVLAAVVGIAYICSGGYYLGFDGF